MADPTCDRPFGDGMVPLLLEAEHLNAVGRYGRQRRIRCRCGVVERR